MVKPPRLKAGDLVAIAAPASPVREEFLRRGVAEIESLGFRCAYDSGILSRRRYLAGSDERRAAEMLGHLRAPESKAIIFARGGYGAARIVDRLMDEKPGNPKIICGYSDVTTLHLLLQKQFDWVTFYGPMAAWEFARGEGSYDRESFLDAVSGERQTFDGLKCVKPAGVVRGPLLGGCLSLLAAAIGTSIQPRLEGSILMIEDENVKPYQLDRMLLQMRLSGLLAGVRGLVFGEMRGCSQSGEQGYELAEVIADVTPEVPVVMNLPAGHAARVSTLPLGVEAELDAAAGRLTVLEAAVS